MLRPLHGLALPVAIFVSVAAVHVGDQVGNWPLTEGAPGGGRYSPLADINRDNVVSRRKGDVGRVT